LPRLSHDLADDPFVRMCQQGDYASFFFGRAGKGEPELALPRFEFLDGVRRIKDLGERAARVERSSRAIITGVHLTKWSQDREHNFMTQRRLPRLMPAV